MTLITSISGIRGTIGGSVGTNLSPLDIVKFTSAYAQSIKDKNAGKRCKVVTGRDGRISGFNVSSIANSTLAFMGIDVIDLDLTTTPTVEVAVTELKADGGIIFTASHNPAQWNALKLLNENGEFINDMEGKYVLALAEKNEFIYVDVHDLGKISQRLDMNQVHIDKVVNMKWVDVSAIQSLELRVVVDGINSTGGVIIPQLLEKLGLKKENIICINSVPDGNFAHNPEPLAEHLTQIIETVKKEKADLGIVVDPDVDRLAFICEDSSLFNEEYTLVSVADYILSKNPGNTVSNLSSTRALKDVTEKYGFQYFASAVGEVNVVNEMKRVNAVIGGEGNGGIIYPELHYGRDALVGLAFFLSLLSEKKCSVTQLRDSYPKYVISKNKVNLSDSFDFELFKNELKKDFINNPINTSDGIRIDFSDGWVHVRKSNTEPIIRIYAEAKSTSQADEYAKVITSRF